MFCPRQASKTAWHSNLAPNAKFRSEEHDREYASGGLRKLFARSMPICWRSGRPVGFGRSDPLCNLEILSKRLSSQSNFEVRQTRCSDDVLMSSRGRDWGSRIPRLVEQYGQATKHVPSSRNRSPSELRSIFCSHPMAGGDSPCEAWNRCGATRRFRHRRVRRLDTLSDEIGSDSK